MGMRLGGRDDVKPGPILPAVLLGLAGGSVIGLIMLNAEVDDLRGSTARLERQVVEADEREVVMAKRLIRLTEQWNQSAKTLDLLTEACLADGWCVADE